MAEKAEKSAGSVARVRAALLAAGHPDTIIPAPAGARTAADAAAALGCEVARIVKSLIFRLGDAPLLVLVSGANRVDPARLAPCSRPPRSAAPMPPSCARPPGSRSAGSRRSAI